MDGHDYDRDQPWGGRDTRADDLAALRWAVAMTVVGLAATVALALVLAWLFSDTTGIVAVWPDPGVLL